MTDSPDRLARLARLVRARRGALGLDVEPIVRGLAMGKETWKKVERGDTRVRASVYGRMERVLGWPAGSIEAYLDGGIEPDEATAPQQPGANTDQKVGEWIDIRRDELGIPVPRLAELVGTRLQAVEDAISGESPIKHHRARWEDALFWARGSLARAYRYGIPPEEIEPGSPGATAEDLIGIPDMTPEEAKVARAVIEALRREAAAAVEADDPPASRSAAG